MTIWEQVAHVPAEARTQIEAGRLKGFTNINSMWRIKQLTETFGVCGFGWKTQIVEKWLDAGSDGEVAANVRIALYVKIRGEWSDPIEGLGGSSFIAKQRSGLYTSDECYKMAYTDAISVACKSLGMGADVYFAEDRTKYSQPAPRKQITEATLDKDGQADKICDWLFGKYNENPQGFVLLDTVRKYYDIDEPTATRLSAIWNNFMANKELI